MRNKKKAKKTHPQLIQKVAKEQQSGKSNTLIVGGVFLAMSSIGLLIFVLREKVLHLN
tara:strand:+ start:276 stop:449 length:174 start_codon:yes stop_codon:yes gene_type:complete